MPPMEPRDECITRMESADFQESSKTENSTSLAEILADNDKFQAHIKEIDIALNNNTDSAMLTNNHDDDIECRNFGGTDKETTDSKSGGPIQLRHLRNLKMSASQEWKVRIFRNLLKLKTRQVWQRFSRTMINSRRISRRLILLSIIMLILLC